MRERELNGAGTWIEKLFIAGKGEILTTYYEFKAEKQIEKEK